MTDRTCLSIILAAGEGTRMKSATPKVLHKVAGLPMVAHVTKAADEAGGGDMALVIGHGADAVRKAASGFAPKAEIYVQEQRLGTAHAVLAARHAIERGYDDLLVMFGDTPLIEASALTAARKGLAAGKAVVVVGFRTENPTGYGRLIENGGKLLAIREEKDCSEEERKITFCNGGLMAISGEHALRLIDRIDNKNAKGEFYLTDIVELANQEGLSVAATEASFDSVLGVNSRVELAEAETLWQQRKRKQVMLSGVTLQAPETVFFSHDTKIGQDTVIEPNVVFGKGVSIAGNVTIRGFSHIEEATVGAGSQVGPYARLRPGAKLDENVHIGNFVEVKNVHVEKGAKANHLAYLGDGRVGAGSNIGAGTIFCNYDGYGKFFTDIAENVFIGSNSSLVAPITIASGAYVATGSVVTESVPEDALAFGRARQTTLPGKAKQLRERRADAAAKAKAEKKA